MDFIKDTTEYIFISSPPKRSDVIFLPGSSDPGLPELAAKLYLYGYAKYVVPSGRYGIALGHFKPLKKKSDIYSKPYLTEAEFYLDVLEKNGVPASSVLCEYDAEFTYQNAVFSRKLLDGNNVTVKNAILVCKSFHARRAYTYYKNSFPEADITVSPVPSEGLSADDWYKSKRGRERVFGELKRLGEQMECCDFSFDGENKNICSEFS